MALAKFSDWMMNEDNTLQNPNMPLKGAQSDEDEANIAQFENVFNNLLRKMDKSKAISKPILIEMLNRFIKTVQEKSTSLGGNIKTALGTLEKRLG